MNLDTIIEGLEKELKWAESEYAKAKDGEEPNPDVYYEDLGYCEGVVDTLINTINTIKIAKLNTNEN